MQNHAKLCFCSLITSSSLENYNFWQKRSLADGLQGYRVKIANQQKQKKKSFYVFDRFVNFLCNKKKKIMHFFVFTWITFRLLSDYHKQNMDNLQ